MSLKKPSRNEVYAKPRAGQFPLKQFKQFGSKSQRVSVTPIPLKSIPTPKGLATQLRLEAAKIKQLRKLKAFPSLGCHWTEREVDELLFRAQQWDQVAEKPADAAKIRPLPLLRVRDEIQWLVLNNPDEPTFLVDDDARDNKTEQIIVEDVYGSSTALAIFEEAAEILQAQANEGDEVAAEALVQATIALNSRLNALIEQNPDQLRRIAQALPHWPMLIGRTEDAQKTAGNLFEQFNVGRENVFSGVFRKGRKPDFKRPVNTILADLFDYLHFVKEEAPFYANSAQSQLPDWVGKLSALPVLTENRSEKNFKDWFEIAWLALIAVCPEGKPEKVAVLHRLGEHKKNHSLNRDAQKKVTDRTRDSNIRAGIKEALKQAARRLIIPVD